MRAAAPWSSLLLVVLILAAPLGCGPASTSRPVRGPDGKRWFAVTCRDEQSACLAEAALRCPKGYRTAASAPSSGSMMVRCKEFAVEGSFLVCLGDESCELGEKCVFPKDQGMFDSGTGRCERPRAK